jgi:hypothetical protein
MQKRDHCLIFLMTCSISSLCFAGKEADLYTYPDPDTKEESTSPSVTPSADSEEDPPPTVTPVIDSSTGKTSNTSSSQSQISVKKLDRWRQ